MTTQSDAELVRQFTTESGVKVPNSPKVMNKEEVFFLIKMLLDEIMELGATVAESEEVKMKMIRLILDSRELKKSDYTEHIGKIIGEQADALVDLYYYSLNAACKKGVNLSKIFNIVHDSNMKKKDPETGQFIKNKEGKIMKPIGWTPPDITGEIFRQSVEGSFD